MHRAMHGLLEEGANTHSGQREAWGQSKLSLVMHKLHLPDGGATEAQQKQIM